MTSLRFCLVLHIHQPVGNFEHVFREHADDVYSPFLDFLDSRDLWPIGLHVSGPLLEWMGEKDAALHDRIGRLATDGRIELLSSAWYEPVLAALPRQDRAEQLEWAQQELEARFGIRPTGLWLTERVWEPDLPADLAPAGIEYVLVDDHILKKAGVTGTDLQGPVRTEANGQMLDLLPIDERLRYLIPFRPAEEVAGELRARHSRGDGMALIGDDGEKFGGWPRTREWLYDGGWLEAFGDRMDELRGEGVVQWVTPAQCRQEIAAVGPAYVPSGSYPEMEGWALGGHWKGFLARYPEANRMHKRMLALSALCRERGDPEEVRRAIGRSQCNDAYWHGVFGGLYMKHLREGVRRQMIVAERKLREDEPLDWTRADVDADGREEWWAHGARVSAWIRADGEVTDLIWLEAGKDVLDVLTRYREVYHEEALQRSPEANAESGAEAGQEGGSAPSIHDIEESATLDELPPVDPAPRVLVRDRVLPSKLSRPEYEAGAFDPIWVGDSYVGHDPQTSPEGGGGLTWTFRAASVRSVEKVISLDPDGTLSLEWSWPPDAFPKGSWFSPEVSLGCPVSLSWTPDAEAWRYAIVTTSKCPDGFEEIEQGHSITPRWPTALGGARLVLSPTGA